MTQANFRPGLAAGFMIFEVVATPLPDVHNAPDFPLETDSEARLASVATAAHTTATAIIRLILQKLSSVGVPRINPSSEKSKPHVV